MKEQTSTSKILDSMDEGTKYSTPIFGSEASTDSPVLARFLLPSATQE